MTSAIEFFSRSTPHTPQQEPRSERPVQTDRFEEIFEERVERYEERPGRSSLREREDTDRERNLDSSDQTRQEPERDDREVDQSEDERSQSVREERAPTIETANLTTDQTQVRDLPVAPTAEPKPFQLALNEATPVISRDAEGTPSQLIEATVTLPDQVQAIDEIVITRSPEQALGGQLSAGTATSAIDLTQGQPTKADPAIAIPATDVTNANKSPSQLIAEATGNQATSGSENSQYQNTQPGVPTPNANAQVVSGHLTGSIIPGDGKPAEVSALAAAQANAHGQAVREAAPNSVGSVPQSNAVPKPLTPSGEAKERTVTPLSASGDSLTTDIDPEAVEAELPRRPVTAVERPVARPQAQTTAPASPQPQTQAVAPLQMEPAPQTTLPTQPITPSESVSSQIAQLQGSQPLSIEEPVSAVTKPDGASLTHGRTADVATQARVHMTTPATLQSDLALAMSRSLRDGITKFEIQMDPPELGRIDVQLELSKDGRVQAILSADNQETLDLLQRDQKHLFKALQDSGLDLDSDSLNFSLNDESQREGNDDQGQNTDLSGVILDEEVGSSYLTEIVGAPLETEAYGFRTRTETGISIRV